MQSSIETLLASYPRTRPPLTPEHQQRYVSDYLENRGGKSGVFAAVARLESWMHRTVAAAGLGGRILELGAGTLNHVPYERNYTAYDVIEPFEALWRGSPTVASVQRFYDDIRDVPEQNRYDRIVSVAVLEHLTDLPYQIATTGLLLEGGGTMAAGIPSEGSFAWRLAWQLGTGTVYRIRTGLNYAILMKHEHVNSARDIEEIVRHFYGDVHVRRFPLSVFNASVYSVITATNPHTRVCYDFVESRGGER